MRDVSPLVTIGIPTYQRPEFLSRALECVARQTTQEMCVLVSDNATPGDAVRQVVDSFRDRIPGLTLFTQEVNIGGIANFFFLLEQAKTKYFMWLADDDEISDNYVQSLVTLLEADDHLVTAAGNWYYQKSDGTGDLMPPCDFASERLPARLARYLWRADDAFFYGVHRTDVLRHASFGRYVWPNRDEVRNFAYVYLLDLVLRGKVRVHPDKSVRFINHDYTVKAHARTESRVGRVLRHAARRVNVHALYLQKIRAVRGFGLALPMAFVSAASLTREGLEGAVRIGRRLGAGVASRGTRAGGAA